MKIILPVLIAISAYVLLTPKSETIEIKAEATQEAVSPDAVDNAKDDRVERVHHYLEVQGSPMVDNAQDFVEAADAFDLDWRLLVGVAGAESSFGKHTPSCASWNPFGRISTTSPCGFYRFDSFEHAIYFMAEEVGHSGTYQSYQKSRRLIDLANTYCPSNAGAWVEKVNYFLEELK